MRKIIFKIGFSLYLASFMMVMVTVAGAAEQQSQHSSWNFRVLLDGDEIGHHSVKLNHNRDKSYVVVDAKFDVTLFYIPVYSYKHSASEVWQNGCIDKIVTETDDNGDRFFISGSRGDNALQLTTHNGNNQINGCVRTFAYWNIDLLKSQRLLNTQTGEYQTVELTDLGVGNLIVGDKKLAGQHYRLEVKDMTLDLWYSQNDSHWLALQATTESGAVLSYLPEQLFNRKPT